MRRSCATSWWRATAIGISACRTVARYACCTRGRRFTTGTTRSSTRERWRPIGRSLPATCRWRASLESRATRWHEAGMTTEGAFDVGAHARRIEDDGYTIIPDFLTADDLKEVRHALDLYLGTHRGRNDFEGTRTERVYTLVARARVFWR